MTFNSKRIAGTSLAISLGLALSACGGITTANNNFSLNSVNQPVVERSNYVLDLRSGVSGIDVAEQSRLDDWFEMLDLGYGDRVAVDSSVTSAAAEEDIAAVAARYGILLSEGAPVTQGYVEAGMVRVVVTRSTAHVPGCPDWSEGYGFQQGNYTSDGYGCAVNSNLAAMVADPEHLLDGAEGTGETVVMTSNRAIDTYRNTEPTGAGGLPQVSSEGGN
ncbi:CpaD family pilus assembly protein [Aurantiacibacter gangjinensis]|uniref:Pilus assembly protein CpaD n=1 Tax=Aurantiacibacter gangjinensis TaxID=502682 RepID=A0A0G9MSQ4_9SPHN|nr:CpaD family pilus assembly protein [Aurantiacibacter gangjinensis]APE27070.1 Flp pilus assembly protein CpaD [Aurantiacibacter gangjinensis]KLE33730.1 pilus assembly protein CpaD [Aurantiacibacter gangjinensis]